MGNDAQNNKLNEGAEAGRPETGGIIGPMPKWITRYGTIILAVILLIIFSGAFFIKYPDTVDISATIYISETPKVIAAPKSGRFDTLFAQDNTDIQAGQVIAVMEDSSDYPDILNIKDIAQRLDTFRDLKKGISEFNFPANPDVGFLSRSYHDFLIALDNYKKLSSGNTLVALETQTTVRNNIKTVLDNIKTWEDKNILKSPIEGRIRFLRPLSSAISVRQGEQLISIIPKGISEPSISGVVNRANVSNLHVDQKINLNISDFPSQQYGTLEGNISQIIPIDTGYLINIVLKKGLITTTGFHIPREWQYIADGKVNINNRNILSHLFRNIKPDNN